MAVADQNALPELSKIYKVNQVAAAVLSVAVLAPVD